MALTGVPLSGCAFIPFLSNSGLMKARRGISPGGELKLGEGKRRTHREENTSFVLEILYRHPDSSFDDNRKESPGLKSFGVCGQ
jgi:hypothetical protein